MLRALRRLPCLRGWATSTRTCEHSASARCERHCASSSRRRMSAFSTDDWAASTQHNYHHGARCGCLCLHQHGGTSMFEEIFFPRTAERYRAAPLVEQRERYLVHLRETGARRPTLRKCANDQLSLVRLLNLKEGGMPADDCLGPHARRRRLRDRRVLQRETMLHLRIFLAR